MITWHLREQDKDIFYPESSSRASPIVCVDIIIWNIKVFSPTLTASTSIQMDRSRPLGHQGLARVRVQASRRFDMQPGLCNHPP